MDKKYKLSGVGCMKCVNKIQTGFSEVEGVSNPVVDVNTKVFDFSFDESKITEEEIKEKIVDLGYGFEKDVTDEKEEVLNVETTKEETENNIDINKSCEKFISDNKSLSLVNLRIEKIHCQACVANIERSLVKIEGVDEAIVNLATNKGRFLYDESKINIDKIIDSINNLGYLALKEEEITEEYEKEKEIQEKKDIREFKILIFLASIVFYITMGHMIGLPLPSIINPMMSPMNYAMIQLILTIPVLILGRHFYTSGIPALFRKSPNMDSLISLGTGAAFIYSLFGTYMIITGDKTYVHALYYESAVVIIALISLGKLLEKQSKGKTSEAIKKLMGLQVKTAIIIKNGEMVSVDINHVEKDDIVMVRPGESIPVDGIVIEGSTYIDESMLTGESIAVKKEIDSKVYGATINKNGSIKIKASAVGKETILAKIIKLVEEAQGSKAPIAKLADEVSKYFVPIVIIIGIISSLTWYILGSRGIVDLHMNSSIFALTILISVLVIACPCSLGLATPTAIMVGTGRGAELGILIKSGEALEKLHKIDTIILDKTGTITEGEPSVTDIVISQVYSKEEVMKYVGSLEKHSEHPLGEAIVSEAKKYNDLNIEVKDFKNIVGQGIEGVIDGRIIFVGNEKLFISKNIEVSKEEGVKLASQGKTPVYIGIDNKYIGVIGIADKVKESSVKAIEDMKKQGLKVGMITGDKYETAKVIGHEVGVDFILAEVSPKDKYLEVKKLQEEGRVVAMVGDGINDSIALSQADVGLAIGNGTDIAIESADVVLMKSNLEEVGLAIRLSHATIKNIKENLFWAFLYNSLGIPVAAGGLYLITGHLLNPMIAGGAMAMSSVSVVTNALRLRNFGRKEK